MLLFNDCTSPVSEKRVGSWSGSLWVHVLSVVVAGVGKEDFGDDNKGKKKRLFLFFSNVTNRGYCTTGRDGDKINERKHTKETQRKDLRKTSQREK